MDPAMQQVFKDIVFNLQSYIYWFEQYHSEGEWTYLKNQTNHYNRLVELVPQAVEWLREHDIDDLCG